MKIGIITVYNGMNSGSFWQAFALKHILNKKNHEVFFLDRKGEGTASKFYQIGKVIKTLFLSGPKEGIHKFLSFKKFLYKQRQEFRVIQMKDLKNMDCLIIGSDTVWNMDSKHFRDNYKIYWGISLNHANINAYACSVANTSYDSIVKYSDIKLGLKKMNHIAVRDQQTYDIIEKISNQEVELVCDPTLLLTSEEYITLLPRRIESKKYIFLYLFEDLNEMHQKELIEFAHRNDLVIISGFEGNKYCDKTIINTPDNFLNYMMYAEYIITDTFHGNVFSVNLQKQFVSIDRKKTKVTDFLKLAGVENQLTDSKQSLISSMLCKIDYSIVNEKIELLRKQSMNYLKKIEENCNGSNSQL